MPKRSTKFYRKNEAEVMDKLGFVPTKNSGAGWIEKEDGQNEFAICQLKSTDKESISVKQKDLRVLEYNASVAHKLPVFAIQFLNTNEVWVMIKPEDLEAIKSLVKGETKTLKELDPLSYMIEQDFDVDKEVEQEYNVKHKGNVRKSLQARQAFMKQKEEEAEQNRKGYQETIRERRKTLGKKIQTKGSGKI